MRRFGAIHPQKSIWHLFFQRQTPLEEQDNAERVFPLQNTTTAGPLQSESMQKALAMVERMSTQNNFEDIILDFKVIIAGALHKHNW